MKTAQPLVDPLGRKIDYLRLSVTDRCNLRCTYCMPGNGISKLNHEDILSYEELLRIAKAAVAIGVEKIRVTGGEPLVRKGIIPFLERLSGIPGLKRLVLTTNGVLLNEMASDLRRVGIESLNISLDSLQEETFYKITRGGEFSLVMNGIKAAQKAGFPFIKINVVVMRGLNDNELLDFAALSLDGSCRVRFIEHMPTNIHTDNGRSLFMPGAEILERISRKFHLERVDRESMAGPAEYYRIAGAQGMIGIITPVSCHFCNECNRIRVTSTGFAKSCLFSDELIDLKPFLKPEDQTGLENALRRVVENKPEKHRINSGEESHSALNMSQVGG